MIRFRPLLGPSLWFLPGFVLLVGLGVWQIQRLHEKEALIASVESGLHAPPVPLPQALSEGADAFEWRPVKVSGHFLHDKDKVVRESCIVALDMADYEKSGETEYALVPEVGATAA